MQSSVASTNESRRAGSSSTMRLVGQPSLQEDKSVMYKEGENLLLDRELKSYRKMRLSRGDALNQVFTDDDEFEAFVELVRKERQAIQKLTVEDVSKLIGFVDRIRSWRAYAKREAGRIRKDRLRKKLRKMAQDGDTVALSKIRRVKKAARKRWAKCYKRKRGKKGL